jgi:threonine dehydrogenase-like Zn-dependent dehydrogenase
MRANCWYGKKDVRVETVPDPRILNSSDAIIKVTSTAICGSDLHLYNGLIPSMQKGDGQEAQDRRSRRGAVSDRVRGVRDVPAAALFTV